MPFWWPYGRWPWRTSQETGTWMQRTVWRNNEDPKGNHSSVDGEEQGRGKIKARRDKTAKPIFFSPSSKQKSPDQ